jgi:hypothetical protein
VAAPSGIVKGCSASTCDIDAFLRGAPCPRASSVLKIPGLTSARQANGETRAAMQRPRRRSRVSPIDAGSPDRLARDMAFIEATQPIAMNDLITRDFACLALQNMDGRADPRLKARDGQDRNGWTMPLPVILTPMGPSPTMTIRAAVRRTRVGYSCAPRRPHDSHALCCGLGFRDWKPERGAGTFARAAYEPDMPA